MLRNLSRAAAAAFLCLSGTAALADNPVHSYDLDNGMKILVKEDHRAPVVTSMVWYKVGSSYEHDGQTGLSHALEHMMFKGTDKHPPGEFSKIIAANGGRENAFTSRDFTAYFQNLEKGRLEISLELEADRMRHLKILDDEFAKEIQVVIEERRMRTEDEPEALTSERFNAAAHVTSPYHNPVIGWMTDLDQMTADDIRSWYQTWYAPNNATLVVAGDVNPEEVYRLAKKHFGPLQPSVLPKSKLRTEVEQKGERRITVKAPAELPYLIMGYQTPVIPVTDDNMEPYALAVLSSILDGGNSARFAKRLVREQQVAASVGTGYDSFSRLDSLFLIEGNPAQGKTIAELEKAIRAEIKRLQSDLVNTDELARVKAQVVASKVYEKDSVFYQAMQIGSLITQGYDWKLGDQYADKIQQVTAEQIRDVARKYLTDDRLTVAVLDPQPLDGKRPGHSGAANMPLR
ncbi:MAG: insulinase family protein [Gammaproteobacteria bacterium]|nr:insulinase family protein [Gammaproteobacteria bacterium]